MSNLLDVLSIDQLTALRRMEERDGEAFLANFRLSPELLETARKLYKPSVVEVVTKAAVSRHPDSRMWQAVGWALGASFADLARDRGVSKQSVMNQVDYVIPLPVRKNHWRRPGILPFEHLAEYKIAYFSNVEHLRSLNPKEAAQWLIEHVTLDAE